MAEDLQIGRRSLNNPLTLPRSKTIDSARQLQLVLSFNSLETQGFVYWRKVDPSESRSWRKVGKEALARGFEVKMEAPFECQHGCRVTGPARLLRYLSNCASMI